MKYPPYTSQTQKVRTIRTLKKEGKKKVEYAIAITIHRNKIKGKKKKKNSAHKKGRNFLKIPKNAQKFQFLTTKTLIIDFSPMFAAMRYRSQFTA